MATQQTYEAMRKGGATRNPVWHAVEPKLIRQRDKALCGAVPKTMWVYGGDVDQVTCPKCRVLLPEPR
jgi:hypothetical protein